MHRRPRHRLLLILALSLAWSAPTPAFAQQGEPAAATPTRPSVGLVLSGGGARGGAHIGVLKALEELRVPVDYIAGTSIGAVIGGFYVSGMGVADLEQLVESLEWETAFLNVTPRELKSFRRKRDDDSFLVNQKPGLNDGEFELPFGLVQGQVIDMIISRETLRASQVDNFDQLAIPFRAVAGDLVTGEAVVLSSGSLARAIRASMSIPAALSPIEIDGRLLVDGGIAMNLPVEVAREMGADVVIAVDISSELLGARDAALRARRHVAAHEHADAQRHAAAARQADFERRAARAHVRRGPDVHGVRAHERDHSNRLRHGHAATARSSSGSR